MITNNEAHILCPTPVPADEAMETIKTASFEYLIGMAKEDPAGGYFYPGWLELSYR
jgi:hypothetical protein